MIWELLLELRRSRAGSFGRVHCRKTVKEPRRMNAQRPDVWVLCSNFFFFFLETMA
jgi:hypothetical protein